MTFEIAICNYIYLYNYVCNHNTELRRQQVVGLKNHENAVFATSDDVMTGRKCEGINSSRRCGTTVQVTKLS
jgi:hypothetical protein